MLTAANSTDTDRMCTVDLIGMADDTHSTYPTLVDLSASFAWLFTVQKLVRQLQHGYMGCRDLGIRICKFLVSTHLFQVSSSDNFEFQTRHRLPNRTHFTLLLSVPLPKKFWFCLTCCSKYFSQAAQLLRCRCWAAISFRSWPICYITSNMVEASFWFVSLRGCWSLHLFRGGPIFILQAGRYSHTNLEIRVSFILNKLCFHLNVKTDNNFNCLYLCFL